MRILNWWRRRRIAKAREEHARWKAEREALERMHYVPMGVYVRACGQEARHSERVNNLMRG